MLETIFLILGCVAVVGSLAFISLFIVVLRQNKKPNKPESYEKVVVIVPCKGLGVNLEGNLRAICTQQYPSYEVIFVLDSAQDPAYPLLASLSKTLKNTRVVFAEKLPKASGKISALIAGIHAAGDIDVYVFADSDIQPHRGWLGDLVAPLSEKKVGAATGFRWFFPSSLKTSFISVWNMASMVSLFYPGSTWAWGGSTAIRKQVFDSLCIAERWKTGFSDDLILTQMVRKAGLAIRFVPSCLVESPAETNMKRFLKWGTQQVTWVRWYHSMLWCVALFGMLLLQAFMVLGVVLLFRGLYLQGFLLLSPLFFEMMYGVIGFFVLRKVIRYPKEKFGSVVPFAVFMPFVLSLFFYSLLLSGFAKEITWAGKSYRKSDALNK